MKRFNYTGRKKILNQDISVRLQKGDHETPVVDIVIDLSDYEFQSDAKVYLEAQRQTRFMRLFLGDATNEIRVNNVQLTEFDDSEGIKFRIKIVDNSIGQLLGFAENIKPYSGNERLDDKQKQILPVRSTDLTHTGVLWRIDFSDQEAILEVEKALGHREQIVRSLLFKGFILPAAMREILTKIVADGWDDELSDLLELSTRWLLFSKQVGAGVPQRAAEDYDDWLDDTVRLLTNRIGVRQQIIDDFETGAWK